MKLDDVATGVFAACSRSGKSVALLRLAFVVAFAALAFIAQPVSAAEGVAGGGYGLHALACPEASPQTRSAIDALKAYRRTHGSGKAAEPSASQPGPDAEELQVLRALTDLLISPDFGGDSLCPVLPVDRFDPPPVAGVQGAPAGAETLLTAAVKTCNLKFIKAALKIEKGAGGNVYATSGGATEPPIAILADCALSPGLSALRTQLDPTPIHAPWSARSTTDLWERLQAEGNSGPIVPDVDDVPRRLPGYVTALIAAQQGISIGASTQSGATSPKIQGEIRYAIVQTDKDQRDSRTGLDDGYVGKAFAYLGGNLGPSKDYSAPTSPKWLGTGIGYKEILGAAPTLLTDSRARWIEIRAKFGDEYNLLPTHRANYAIFNMAATYFLAFSTDLDGDQLLRTGTPAYGSITFGGQAQTRLAGQADAGVRGGYTFERIDFYAYPLWALSRLLGGNSADNPACLTTLKSADTLRAGCSSVTLHLDRQIVNNGLGTLSEASVSWGFRKGLSLSFTRSVGTPDPISNLGLKLPRSASSQLSLKVTPGQ